LVATVVVVSCQGRDELRTWGRRMKSWRAAPRWYVLAVLAPATVSVSLVLINHGFGAPLPTSGQLSEWPQMLVTFVMMLIFVGIGEEAGWMAFAAPTLMRRHHLLLAATIGAALRTLWHLPMMLNGELPWFPGIVGNVAFAMVMFLVFQASNGNWWLVAVWHATLNATGGRFLFTMVNGDDRDRLGYLLGVAYTVIAVIAWLVRRRRLARHGDVPTSPSPDLQHSTSGRRHA
jgi:membrane protease YdiL (CAAX protease family)